MADRSIADAIENTLSSPAVLDSNLEDANVVDALYSIARALRAAGQAITPDALPGTDSFGGRVGSLTEAVMGVTAGLHSVSSAIDGLAEAVASK
jgi:hypothetical protein